MPSSQLITRELIAQYIQEAQPESVLEHKIIKAAIDLGDQGRNEIRAEAHKPDERLFGKIRDLPEVEPWRKLILRELYDALCVKGSQYRGSVTELKKHGDLLIGLIAGYVAAKAGVAVAVMAPFVAALLRLALQMGTATFCKRMQSSLSKRKKESPR
jgi:hypothetical protein